MEDIVVLIRLTPRQVLRVFHETCLAVAHMHSQDPPIIHRDLKVSLCHSLAVIYDYSSFDVCTVNEVLGQT